MAYLHAQGIQHGDLKANNVLIDHREDEPHAVICDFGLSVITDERGFTTDSIGATAWLAPELIASDLLPTNASDMWALGMTIYVSSHVLKDYGLKYLIYKPAVLQELYADTTPFHECHHRMLRFSIINGLLPRRLEICNENGMSDELWRILLDCWHKEPARRPSAADVEKRLNVL